MCGDVTACHGGVLMAGIYAAKRKKAVRQDSGTQEQDIRRRLMENAAGGVNRSIRSVDPVYLLANSYIDCFDAVGKERASAMAGGKKPNERTEESGAREGLSPEEQRSGSQDVPREERLTQLRKKHDSPEYAHSSAELEDGDFKDRFSEYAFRGGKMASAVMAGQGKQMLTLSLARTLGGEIPNDVRQKKVLSQSAVELPVDSTVSSVKFNRHAQSAVGVVTDAIRGSSYFLDVFRKLCNDSGQLKQTPVELRGVDTLKQVLPFMVTADDKRQIADYRTRLKALEGGKTPGEQRAAKLLRSALTKQTAVMRRKQAEQRKFMTVLGRIQSNAQEAERLFSSDGFAETVLEDALSLLEDIPPEGGGDKLRSLSEQIAEAVTDLFTGLGGAADGTTENEQEQQYSSEAAETAAEDSEQRRS